MKKLFTVLIAICMLASVPCITAFAAEPVVGTVLRVSALKKDGSTEVIMDYTSFEEGWEAAIDLGESKSDMKNYSRVVVDFYADWKANAEGEFGDSDGDGFRFSTIYIPDDVRITLNLNDHAINRGLKEWEYDGEVIYIDEDADVIINNGTVTGGWSCNGAGGIHINDGANVILNNVNIVGNKVDDDDGAGIAVYDGATLTMSGGCISHNVSYNSVYGGGVFIDEASAVFTEVTFQDNQGINRSTLGAAVYVDDGTLVMDGCEIMDNGLAKASGRDTYQVAYSIIDILGGSNVTIKNTRFSDNGYAQETYVGHNTLKYTTVINSTASYLTIEKCTFKKNNQVYLIQSEATALNVVDSDFTENNSFAFYGNCVNGFNSGFTGCKFSYNQPMFALDYTFFFNTSNAGLSFVDCEFGEATFNNKAAAQFVDTNDSDSGNLTASIFGEGSLAMIFAFIALLASVAAIWVSVSAKKNKVAVSQKAEEEKE